MTGIAHVQTVFPVGADGEIDLSDYKGMTFNIVAEPPQSARPSIVVMTEEQYKQLTSLMYEKGDHQEMCRRICERVEKRDGMVGALVLSTDMARIQQALKSGETGKWQDLFREIVSANPPQMAQ
jgi:hypothetical protein